MPLLSSIPFWPWGLLTALMALGFSQTHQRGLVPSRLLMPSLALLHGGLSGRFRGHALALLKLTRNAAAPPSPASLQWSAGRGKPLEL